MFYLKMDGTVFEEERYILENDVFYLKAAAGETFEPPLPLIEFPLNIGDKWSWQGTMRSGDVPHAARADVGTTSAPTQLVVRVDLELDSGSGKPSKRTLTFWFERERGIVKRELGASSTRLTVEE